MALARRLLRREEEAGEDVLHGQQVPVHEGDHERCPADAILVVFSQ
jgi:hypothetical protein